MQHLTIFVPSLGSAALARVVHGSAIVGTIKDAATVVVDYEGNTLKAENLQDFEGRLQCAAGRHVERYPTTARAHVSPGDLVAVGTAEHLDGYGWLVTAITDAPTLAAWLSPEPLPPINGSEEFRGRVAAKALRSLSPTNLARLTAQAEFRREKLVDVIFEQVRGNTPALLDTPEADR